MNKKIQTANEKDAQKVEEIIKAVDNCTDNEAFVKTITKAYLINNEFFRKWRRVYLPYLENAGKTDAEIGDAVGTSEGNATRFRSGPPKFREYVLALAVLFKLSEKETNKFLQTAGYGELYPKTADDCIWIYLLRKGCGDESPMSEFNRLKTAYGEYEKRWFSTYEDLLRKSGKTDADIAAALEKKEAGAKRLHKTLPKRDVVILLAVFFGLSESKANELLRIAGYGELNKEKDDDKIWLHVIEAGGSCTPLRAFRAQRRRLRIKKKDEDIDALREQGENTDTVWEQFIDSLIVNGVLTDEQSFLENLWSKRDVLDTAFARQQNQWNLMMDLMDSPDDRRKRVFLSSVFVAHPCFKRRLYYEMETYMPKGLPPTRETLLAFAIHVGTSLDETNELLECAHQAQLSPYDVLELAIRYIHNLINREAPQFFDPFSKKPCDKKLLDRLLNRGMAGYFLTKLMELSECMKSAECGVGFSLSDIDVDSFIALLK